MTAILAILAILAIPPKLVILAILDPTENKLNDAFLSRGFGDLQSLLESGLPPLVASGGLLGILLRLDVRGLGDCCCFG